MNYLREARCAGSRRRRGLRDDLRRRSSRICCFCQIAQRDGLLVVTKAERQKGFKRGPISDVRGFYGVRILRTDCY